MATKKKDTNGASAPQATLELKIGRITEANHTGDWVDPAALREHPRNKVYFTEGPVEALERLGEDLATAGYKEAIVVTDETCGSGADVVIRGWRRTRAAAIKGMKVPVLRVSNLTVEQEEQALVRDNLSDLLGRRYVPSERALLVRGLVDNYTKLGLAGVGNNSDGSKPRTAEVIAKELGETTNGIKDLEAVFGSPHSTAALQAAVDDGTVALSVAVKIVREVGREPAIAAAVKKVRKGESDGAADTVIADARAKVDAALKELLAGRDRPKTKAKPEDAKPEEGFPAKKATNADGRQTTLEEFEEALERHEAASGGDLKHQPSASTSAGSASMTLEKGGEQAPASGQNRSGDDDKTVTTDDGEPISEKRKLANVTTKTAAAKSSDDEPILITFRIIVDGESRRGEFAIGGYGCELTLPIGSEPTLVGTIVAKKAT